MRSPWTVAALISVALLVGAGSPAAAAAQAAVRLGGMAYLRSADRNPVRAASRSAAASSNPVAASQGFTVFVKGNATFNSSVVGGPVALGGNLTFGPATFSLATQTAGTFTAAGDARPTGLLVGGNVNWAGTSSSGTLGVQSNSYVKIGDLTGSAVAQSGSAATHIVPAGHSYNQSPQIAETVTQPTASVSQSGLVNFASAFSTLSAQSGDMSSCAGTVVLSQANGTPLSLPLPPGTNAFVTLTPGVQNVLSVSAADLNNIAVLNFRNVPTATMPLIINVNTSGVGNSFSWSLPNINGFSNPAAQYLLWNFPTATQLTVGGSQTVPGTIDAPGATVTEVDSNGINGGVIAAGYSQGGSGGSLTGGQVIPVPFTATIQSCATAALTIALTADTSTAVPGQTVHYTVSVTNSGSTAITGASFTQSLAGVIDDATYRNDASATAGSVTFSSPTLSWTGNLAAGATATITFSVAVNNPDAGNDILATSVTSPTTGSNCASGSTDSRCSSSVAVSVLTIASTASPATSTPGGKVSYTVTVTNSGQAAYTGAALTDSLAGVLDDASYNNDATATAGSVSFASPSLTWTGNLAIGASATITFSVTVKTPDPGDDVLSTTVTSATAGNNCPSGSTDARCKASVTVLVPGLTIAATADTATATPGSTVHYTVTVTDTGHSTYTGAVVTDSLSGLLDDATYNNNASATAGGVTFASPNLTWTGSLAVGASVTITFSVTVSNPDTGEKLMVNTVTSDAAGSNCPAGGSDPRCAVSVEVLVPGLAIAASADVSSTSPGSTVRYSVVVTNTGDTPFASATFADPLGGVLDDATYNNDASATAGSTSFSSPNLTWTGSLAVGAKATITFSVTVHDPDTGNKLLTSTVTSSSAGSNCAVGSGDPACSVTIPVAQLTIVNGSNVSTTTPGGIVRFTTTFTNTGQTPYTGITVATDASNVFDDATPNGDQTASSGTLVVTATGVTWTGSIPVGGVVTITGTVTVKNPDPGNKTLAATIATAAPGSNCPPGGSDPRCSVSVTVQVPALNISQTANATFAVPGQTVTFTITIADTGQTAYTGAVVTEALLILDDAAYNNDAVATSGSVSFASPDLTWTGDLSPGGSAVITYSVTVDNPDTGDKQLTASLSSTETGSSCPPNSPNPGCTITVPVLTPGLDIIKTASPATVIPGQTVSYTISVHNDGQIPYTGIAVTDSLAGVLDDASYNNDAAATAGSVSFASPVLTWTGDLAVGASITITYTVSVHNPDTGNKTLTNTVASTAKGSECLPGGTDPACTTTVTVVNATTLTFTATAAASSTTAGGVVHYTVTVANSGASTYSGATFTEPLTGVLDDASFNNDASATGGTVSFAAPDLTWTGDVPAAGTVTITYSVTVHNPDTGNKILATTVSSTSPGSNCPAASTDPRCTVTVTVSQLRIVNSANVTSTTPGGVVRFTSTFTNTGQTLYDGITIATDASDVFDDAVPNGDQTASSGTLVLTSTGISWTGDIPVGGTVTVTGTVTVKNPDPGNKALAATLVTAAPGSNCPPGGTDPSCSVDVPVLIPALSISQAANVTFAVPGQTVTFTVTIADTGQTSYPGATVTDTLLLLDDASYNNDANPTSGAVTYASPVLIWTGNLAPGDRVVITYSVTVHNPDTGDKLLAGTVASTEVGSTCPPDSPNPGCTIAIPVLTPGLTLTISASPVSTTPGGKITYTITVANTGQTSYTGASVTDPLSGVLDDASYNGDASATSGAVSFTSPNLTWTGNLAPTAAATIHFSVTVHNPDSGNHLLASTLTSAAAGNNCPAAGSDPRCSVIVPVAELTIVSTASVSTATPGSVANYTITVTDSGQTSYAGASVTDLLAGVLDDASFNDDGTATSGSVDLAGTDLTWTGDLAPGASTTITFSVTVNDPDSGDKLLTSTVTSDAAGNNCPAGGTDTRCTASVTVLIPVLTITKTANASTTTPGSPVGYTIVIHDAGPTPYTGASVSDALGGVLNDATYNNNAAATSGSVTFTSPTLTWTGDLAPGGSATVTYSVTVKNPDPGDKHMVNKVASAAAGSNCPAGSADPACVVTVDVLVPALTITKTADVGSAIPGTSVGYTITVANTGQTAYTGARVTDSLAGVLPDATYNNDASASHGTVSFASPTLTWTGDLATGVTATITYSVMVSNPDTGGRVLANSAVSADPGSTCPASSSNPACTVTIAIVAGSLSISVPSTAFIGSTAPGGTVSAGLGTVQVTDTRGFGAGWTAAVSATTFTTGTATVAETIPASDVFYEITGLNQATGPATFTFVPVTHPGSNPEPVVSATNVNGNTAANWNPLIQVNTPGAVVAGAYTATITHSVV